MYWSQGIVSSGVILTCKVLVYGFDQVQIIDIETEGQVAMVMSSEGSLYESDVWHVW